MKKITFALFFVVAFAFGQQKQNGWERAGLKGMVKTYKLIGYQFDEKGKPQQMNSEFYAEFDKKGINTKMRAINNNTVINYVDTRDENGNILVSDSRDASNTSMSKNTYEYDQNGNCVRHDVLTSDGSVFMSRLTAYDSNQRVIERTECIAGVCDDKTTYVYGDNNKVSEETKLGKDNVVKGKTVFTYDAQGNAIEKKLYDAENNLEKLVKSTFDENNNEVETLTYDSYGNLLRKETNVYVYDKKKNWVKKTTSVGDKPTMMMKQKLKYY